MSLGLSSAVAAAAKAQEEKQAREKEKTDTDTVSRLLVSSDLPPEKIAEIAGTSKEFVQQTNAKLQR